MPPSLQWPTVDPCLCRRPYNTHRWVLLSLLWSHCSFTLDAATHKILFVPSKSEVCFPQPCANPTVQSCWPLKSDFLGIPSLFAESLSWEVWCGAQNLYNSTRISLVLLFSSLWVIYPVGVGFGFIMIAPSPLSLNVGSLFFWWVPTSSCHLVGSNILLSMVVPQLVAILVLSQEEMSTRSSTPPSWTNLASKS